MHRNSPQARAAGARGLVGERAGFEDLGEFRYAARTQAERGAREKEGIREGRRPQEDRKPQPVTLGGGGFARCSDSTVESELCF